MVRHIQIVLAEAEPVMTKLGELSVPPGVWGEINMLSQVKGVQQMQKFCSKTAAGGADMNVHISNYYI